MTCKAQTISDLITATMKHTRFAKPVRCCLHDFCSGPFGTVMAPNHQAILWAAMPYTSTAIPVRKLIAVDRSRHDLQSTFQPKPELNHTYLCTIRLYITCTLSSGEQRVECRPVPNHFKRAISRQNLHPQLIAAASTMSIDRSIQEEGILQLSSFPCSSELRLS